MQDKLTLIDSWKKTYVKGKGGGKWPEDENCRNFFPVEGTLVKFSEVIEKSSLNTINQIELSKCHVMWRHSVSTWRHEVTELTIHILACRCARKLILFLFPWIFRSLSSKMLSIYHLYDAVTSWRHVMTSENLIYLSQLVDVLESWFFFCFHGFLGHWVQKCY